MADSDGVISNDIDVAERALAEYGLPEGSSLTLLNLSENATYAVEDAGTGATTILRVHRQNYHLPHQIDRLLDHVLDSGNGRHIRLIVAGRT